MLSKKKYVRGFDVFFSLAMSNITNCFHVPMLRREPKSLNWAVDNLPLRWANTTQFTNRSMVQNTQTLFIHHIIAKSVCSDTMQGFIFLNKPRTSTYTQKYTSNSTPKKHLHSKSTLPLIFALANFQAHFSASN